MDVHHHLPFCMILSFIDSLYSMAAGRLPIFSFPQSVAQQILNNIPIAELFEISLLSKSAFDLIKSSVIIDITNCQFDLVLSSSSFVNSKCGNDIIKWHFYGKRDSGRQELEDVETRTVKVSDGESGALVFSKLSRDCYGRSFDSIQDVLQLAQYLCSLFNDHVFNLKIDATHFQNLEAIQSYEAIKKSELLYILDGIVSHDEMIQIIEGFEPRKMQIWCDPGPNFTYNRPIRIRDFRIYAGSWFKGPMLLNLHSEHVTVMNVDVTEEDIIAFLNQELENRDGCRNIITAVFFREPSKFVYHNRMQMSWDTEKITNALSSYEQEVPETGGYSTKRLWRKNRTNFIDVVTYSENPSGLTLLKDINILDADASPDL